MNAKISAILNEMGQYIEQEVDPDLSTIERWAGVIECGAKEAEEESDNLRAALAIH